MALSEGSAVEQTANDVASRRSALFGHTEVRNAVRDLTPAEFATKWQTSQLPIPLQLRALLLNADQRQVEAVTNRSLAA
jgi:hypothetical protein